MRKTRSLFSYIAALLFTFSSLQAIAAQHDETLKIGDKAPSFVGNELDGAKVSLSDYKGKVVVLEWTNFDCPFVRKHYDSNNMQALQEKYTDQGVVWLRIISSAPGKQGYLASQSDKNRAKQEGENATYTIIDSNGEIGKEYHAKTTPQMFIIDKKGNLVYQGAIDSIRSTRTADVAKATPYFKNALDEVLAGKKVDQPSTTPYGCSVKYED